MQGDDAGDMVVLTCSDMMLVQGKGNMMDMDSRLIASNSD